MPSTSHMAAALAVSAAILPRAVLGSACPPIGPVFAPPQLPSESETVQAAAEELKAILDGMTAEYEASGISVAVRSIHEEKPLFTYHYTPPVREEGVGVSEIGDDTIYRVGSISKMMPALAAIQIDSINLDDSVLEYVPELADANNPEAISAIPWEDVTVRSLANHLSGIATDSWADMGLPEASPDGPSCSGLGGTAACEYDDVIYHLGKAPPTYLPNYGPVYSNLAYALLSMVVSNAAGESFEDYVQTNIFDVAGMPNSFFGGPGPDDIMETQGFIPQIETTWNVPIGVYEGAGGMFSTSNDLIAFASAILENKLLSPAETRRWMKPEAFTSSMGTSMGLAWEIWRGDNLTTDNRVIDVYTKAGDLGGYHALVGAIPDYDLTLAVLTGGKEVSVNNMARHFISSAVVSTLLPAIEDAGRVEAQLYEGTFVDEESNSTITIALDNGPGLKIEAFQVRGYDVLNNFPLYNVNKLQSLISGDVGEIPPVEARLYPGGRVGSDPDDQGLTESIWRAIFDTVTDEQRAEMDSQLFFPSGSCQTLFSMDRSWYDRTALAEFGFLINSHSNIVGVRSRAFDVNLVRDC